MSRFIREYEECINELYKELPLPIYNKIVATGIKGKLNKLTIYAKKQSMILEYFFDLLYIIYKD